MSNLFPVALLCDLVIQDVYGKLSAIGIYTSDVLISSLPAELRLSGLVIFQPQSEGRAQVRLVINMDGHTVGETMTEIEAASPSHPVALSLGQMSFHLVHDTEIELHASVNGAPSELILRTTMKQGEVRPLSQPAGSASV
jgi:hypothetical protein